jgi:hypothetical protein
VSESVWSAMTSRAPHRLAVCWIVFRYRIPWPRIERCTRSRTLSAPELASPKRADPRRAEVRYASAVAPRPRFTDLDVCLCEYLAAHRSPDDAVVERVADRIELHAGRQFDEVR